MKMKGFSRKLLITLLGLVLCLSLFHLVGTPAASSAPSLLQEVAITDKDNARHIEVSQGQVLVIKLKANLSAGYGWEVAEVDGKVLRQAGDIEFVPLSEQLGEPGEQILRFEAVNKGQSPLKLVYRRPWEKGAEPTATFSVQAVVNPSSAPIQAKTMPGKGLNEPKLENAQFTLPGPAARVNPKIVTEDNSGGQVQGDLGFGRPILGEGFEGDFPGTNWVTAGNPTWNKTNHQSARIHTGSYSGYCVGGGSSGVNPPGPYPNNTSAWMVYGPFSLSDAIDAQLFFYHWTKTESSYDYLAVAASVNGHTYYGPSYSGNWGGTYGWCNANLDLKNIPRLGNLCGYRQVWIAFIFISDSSNTYEGSYLDDISLRKVVGPRPSLPAALNWRNSGGVTPPKDQGQCGSCWAFSTVGALESNILLRQGFTEDLSEQYLLACNTDVWSCSGGLFAHDYHQWKTVPGDSRAGAVLEADFPYQASVGPCAGPYNHPYRIVNSACIGAGGSLPSCSTDYIPPVDDIKRAIMTYGPVSACIRVGSAFGAYTGGVFLTDEPNMPINHAIVLVGWDDAQGTNGVWFLKNSWGPSWGENSGYMRIGYGISSVGISSSYVIGEDIPLAIDWNGDHAQEFGLSHQGGQWFIDTNRNGTFDWGNDLQLGTFGSQAGDKPLAIDWDGDGRQELCIFRAGTWIIDLNHDGVFNAGDVQLGPFGTTPGDRPLAIDWNGDHTQELCIFRAGTWYIDVTRDGLFGAGDVQLGPFGQQHFDRPIAIDWDGDVRQELCIFRAGTWIIDLNHNGVFGAGDVQLGPFGTTPGDRPVAIDWDGDVRQELCIYRAGTWIIDLNHDGVFNTGDVQHGIFGE